MWKGGISSNKIVQVPGARLPTLILALSAVVGLCGCGPSASSEAAIEPDGTSISLEAFGGGIYNEDGSISASADLAKSGSVKHAYLDCDPRPGVLIDELSPEEQLCRLTQMNFRRVLPLTTPKDFEVAEMDGFLRKEEGSITATYKFVWQCPESRFGEAGISEGMDIAKIERVASQLADCTIGSGDACSLLDHRAGKC